MIGGCCGSEPSHIGAIADAVRHAATSVAREGRTISMALWSGGPGSHEGEAALVNIGERCNIAGSAAFKKLVMAGNYNKCGSAAKQVANGAHVVDINLDDGLLDGISAMQKFCKIAVTEPGVSKALSDRLSKFEIVEAGLQCVQGRCIVS